MGYAQQALLARQNGDYQRAEEQFRLAFETTPDVYKQADILLNLADTVRRDPYRIAEAREMLYGALNAVGAPTLGCLKLYGAILHHMGRLERQAGSYELSELYVRLGRAYVRTHNSVSGQAPVIDTLTTLLDTASILALNGFPWRARLAALQALYWSFRRLSEPSGGDHKLRALVLLVFAGRPQTDLGFVCRAFFGREEESES